ncbi:MAG: AmmeMemoRadiSam system radical SAM enzyme [Candidatus Micrarchaeota archaeon]|nr:MAG: AmmeMemoRadiSam system radical SAM enzyme [Candidatus Micrarchaeota archaeon]
MKVEARLYKNEGGYIKCLACARYCRIPNGSHGFCYVRANLDNKLYLLSYGKVEALQIDPIEKKPFNHFMPGSVVLGVGTSSCNFSCQFCQNHNISKDKEIKGEELSPEDIVEIASINKVDGIAYTYNEPTIFIEFALDIAKLAKKKGMFNVFVTNGYLSEEAVDAISGYIDAAVVNFKGEGFYEKFMHRYMTVNSPEPIKNALIKMKEKGMHIEITDLVIPRVGDNLEYAKELCLFIKEELGEDTPIHFNRFHPDYKMLDIEPTSFESLYNHYRLAKDLGLRYVYIGNVFGNRYESTYCPGCGNPVILRKGYEITGWNLDKDYRCIYCGYKIDIRGRAFLNKRLNDITPLI